MQKPVTKMNPCYCDKCKRNSIVCITLDGRTVDLNSILDRFPIDEIKAKLDTITISKMKCLSCNTEYVIEWVDGLPKPLRLNLFLLKMGIKL